MLRPDCIARPLPPVRKSGQSPHQQLRIRRLKNQDFPPYRYRAHSILTFAPVHDLARIFQHPVVAAFSGDVLRILSYLFSPVNTDDYVFHLFVDKIRHLVRHMVGVCRQRKANILAMRLFLLSSVFHGLLHNIKFISGSPPKKNQPRGSCARRMPDQKNRLPPLPSPHPSAPAPVVFPGVRKTVRAPEVAVLRNKQAQRFNHRCVKLRVFAADFAFRI